MKSRPNSNAKRKGAQSPVYSMSDHSATNFRKKLGWLIAEAPDAVRMTVDPEMAEIMMERNASDEWKNRPQSTNGRARFARLMSQGRWRYTAETIVFSCSGNLLNGQHRLSACIDSKSKIDVLVAFGVEDEAFKCMDCGIARTSGSAFAIEGIPNYNFVASACRIVYAYVGNQSWGGNLHHSGAMRVETDELIDFYYQHPLISESFHIAMKISREGLLSPRWAGAMHYICAMKSRAMANDFFERVATGLGIDSDKSPEYALRKKLLQSARQSPENQESHLHLGAYTIIAWNDFRRGNDRLVFRWRTSQNPNEKFPRAV